MKRVAVLDDWQRVAESSADWSALRKRADVTFFHEPFGGSTEVVHKLRDFDAILAMRERTTFPLEVVDQLPRLRFFNMTGRRARGLDEMVRRGITVSSTGGGETGEDTAEHTLALMLALARHIPEGDQHIRNGGFMAGVAPGIRLAGRTVGILGFGLIGTRVAAYCRALGMHVVAWSRSMTAEKARLAGVESVSQAERFERSDVVSVNLVLSPETAGIVDASQLARMRDGAILINTSRASLVDEPALLNELQSGRLNAALDVFIDEPLPADHPLRRIRNTVLTPHVGYGTVEGYQLFYRNSVENTLAFLDGSPIRLYQAELHEFQ